MPIGYIGNLSNIQQGNQQVINSMVGLGQQISHSIETHAARQSAQAMLPMLQQQYQQGMQKISSGDPNGIGDVYGASMIASQNPLLAPMANHAINLANSANIQTQHTLRTQAAQQGAMQRYQMRYGQGAVQKPITANEKANLVAKYRAGSNTLWDGVKDNVEDFLDPSGDEKKASSVANAIARYNAYKGDLADQGIQFSDPNFESTIAQLGGKTQTLQQQAQQNPSAIQGQHSILGMKFGGHPVADELKTMQSRFEAIAPSTMGAAKASAINQDALLNSARNAIQRGADPAAVMKRLQEHGIDTGGMNLQAPSGQPSPAMPTTQPTSMIPAASSMGGMAQAEPEEQEPVEEPEEPTSEV